MATNLRGVMAALLTPFDQQQALDKASLRRLVQFNIQQGIDGLYVGGSTGEAFVQSLSEREQVLEIVAEEAKGKIKLIGWFADGGVQHSSPEWGKTDPGSDQHPGYVAWRRCAETDLWRSLSDGADPS